MARFFKSQNGMPRRLVNTNTQIQPNYPHILLRAPMVDYATSRTIIDSNGAPRSRKLKYALTRALPVVKLQHF